MEPEKTFITSRPGDDNLLILSEEGQMLTQSRLKFDHEKLRDQDVACTFQARIGNLNHL